MKTIAFGFALAAAVLAAAPAFAGDARLAWNDLDLASPAGKAELDRRIDAAALQVCTVAERTGSHIRGGAAASCLDEARRVIAAQIAAKVDRRQAMASPSGSPAGTGAGAEARR